VQAGDSQRQPNNFRIRKFSRNGSLSQRSNSDARVNLNDSENGEDEVKIDHLKKSIESEDEGDDLQMVVENRSLERVGGSRKSRLPHSQHHSQNVSSSTNSKVRESSEHGIKLMKVNVELNNG
jgi:hypothetical protein